MASRHIALPALLSDGFDGELVIVGDEVHKPYDRPPLSKQILGRKAEDDSCFYDCEPLTGIDWKLGAAAAALDAAAAKVTLEDGEEVEFDGLIVATGRRAQELPGFHDHHGVHTLRSLDDSRPFAMP